MDPECYSLCLHGVYSPAEKTIKIAILLVKYKLKWDHIARRLNPDLQNHKGFLKGVPPKLRLEK